MFGRWKKPKPVSEKWRRVPFLMLHHPIAIDKDGVIIDLFTDEILKPYPYPEDSFNKELVHIAEDKVSIYIDGPALADVIFEKPGSDPTRQCVFMTGYKWIK